MNVARFVLLTSALVSTLVAAPPVAARPTTAARCGAAQLHAAARLVDGRLRCAARAAADGVASDGACDAAVAKPFVAAFARILARDVCETPADAGQVATLVGPLLSDVVTALRPTLAANRCAAGKLRAAGRRALGLLSCRRHTLLGGGSPGACGARVDDAFATGIDRAERRPPCLTTGDQDAISAALAPIVAAVATLIDPSAGVSGLAATVNGGTIDLTWIAPDPQSGLTSVTVVRRLNTPPTDAADPLAAPVFFGTASAATDDLTTLLPDTPTDPRTYHYAAFGCTAAAQCTAAASRTSLTPTITEALVGGGYVLHWRHAAADVCTDHTDLGTAATTVSPNWWKSCDANCPSATARQLNATGVAQATAIGDAFHDRGIPVGRVLTSEFCRNVTTAQLMSFGPALEERQDITFFVYDEAQRCASTQALLAEVPAAGTNTAIVGHAGFVCPVLDALAWGETAIFKPDGAGGSTFVARVLATDWPGLP